MQDIDKAIDVSDIKYNSTNNYGYITVNFLATLNSSRPMKVLYNEYIVYDEQGIELERASGSQITDIKAGAPTKMHYSYYADEARGKPYKLVITTHLDKNRILWNKEIIL
jgi:predicted N-acyltransferase